MPLITPEKLDEIAKGAVRIAEMNLSRSGHLLPILHLFYSNKESEIIGLGGEFTQPTQLSMLVVNIVRSKQAQAFLLTVEAWAKEIPKDFVGKTLRPTYDPQRKECIVITAAHPTGAWAYRRMFTREANGKIVLGDPAEKFDVFDTSIVASALRPQG